MKSFEELFPGLDLKNATPEKENLRHYEVSDLTMEEKITLLRELEKDLIALRRQVWALREEVGFR